MSEFRFPTDIADATAHFAEWVQRHADAEVHDYWLELIGLLAERDRHLEDHLRDSGGVETFSGSWSTSSQITAGHSGRGYLDYGHSTVKVTLAAGVAGTTDFTLSLYKNGLLVGSVTLPGTTNGPVTASFAEDFVAGDFLTYLGTGGTAAADITAKAVLT